MQNNRKSVISNQIAERPIRSILGLRDVTLSRNVQIQHGEKRVRGEAELLYTRVMLAVSFVTLVSHLFLAVGREVHGESFLIAPCLVCGRCARMRVFERKNDCVITFHFHKSLILGRPDPLLFMGEGVATPD